MLNILFFGQLKDQLKTERLTIDFQQADRQLNTVSQLRSFLQQKGDLWHENLAQGKALVAVDQEMATEDAVLSRSAEIAFFPPVTGG